MRLFTNNSASLFQFLRYKIKPYDSRNITMANNLFYNKNIDQIKQFKIEKEVAQREILASQLSQGLNFNSEDWEKLRQELIERKLYVPGNYINIKNVDGVILKLCDELKLYDVGRLYYKTISSKSSNLNNGIVSRYLALCTNDREYAAKNKDEILAIYHHLRKGSVLEPIITERCIEAVCLFEEHWQESLFLLNEIKNITTPTLTSYCSVIEACFKFGNLSKGWELMRYIILNFNYNLSPAPILAYLNHVKLKIENGEFHEELLNDLFEFLEEFHFRLPNLETIEALEKVIFSLTNDTFKWSLKETYIPRNALCSACRRVLEPVNITNDEFQALKRLFVKKAVIGSNIFLNSSPNEIKNFQSFLSQSEPYDMVVDGLNIAYASGKGDPGSQSTFLKEVVTHFARKNMKVIVLGRKHMLKWPPRQLQAINKMANVFLASNLSQDDPLLLYAALKGGEKTFFISRDFMRSHMFLLEDPHMKLLFKKWLISHQYVLGPINSIYQPVIFPPLPYRPTAQKLAVKEPELCWHIPYDEEYQPVNPTRKAPWLCIRRELKNK